MEIFAYKKYFLQRSNNFSKGNLIGILHIILNLAFQRNNIFSKTIHWGDTKERKYPTQIPKSICKSYPIDLDKKVNTESKTCSNPFQRCKTFSKKGPRCVISLLFKEEMSSQKGPS